MRLVEAKRIRKVCEDSEGTIEHDPPEVGDHERRDHHRDVDDHPERAHAGKALVEDDGAKQAEDELDGNRDDRDLEGEPELAPEDVVAKQLVVVLEPDPLAGSGQAVIVQAQVERIDQREDCQRDQKQYGRRHQQPREGAHLPGEPGALLTS